MQATVAMLFLSKNEGKYEIGQNRFNIMIVAQRADAGQQLSSLDFLATTASMEIDARLGKKEGWLPRHKNPWRNVSVTAMKPLMQVYGPEIYISPEKRNICISEISLRKQFRKWNPNFFVYFEMDIHFQWLPRMGKETELKRRHLARQCTKPNFKRLPLVPRTINSKTGKDSTAA